MKKFYTSLFVSALALMAAATAAAQAPASYTLAVTDAESFASDWTSIDANNDKAPYLWAYDEASGQALYTENRGKAANDWLISPAVNLEAGKDYRVTINLRNASTYLSDKQKFKVFVGKTPDVASMTQALIQEESFATTEVNVDVVCPKAFSPEETGEYYIAFYLYSPSYGGNVLFKSFTVEECLPHPGAVTDLTATAAPLGAMSVELAWTWPAVTDLGGALTDAITGARVYRSDSFTVKATDEYLIATIDGGNPGEAGQWTDTSVETPGYYYYLVVPFNENGVSTSKAEYASTQWVGLDKSIGSIKNVMASAVDGDDHSIAVTFDIPVGSNGGYIDPATISYKIARTGVSTGTVTLEDEWNGELPYVDNTIESLDAYYYKINTIYGGSTSFSAATSNTVVAGGAMSLPYSETFSTVASFDFFTKFHGEGAKRDWTRSSSGYASYWGNPADAWLVTPKIAIETGNAYELSFNAWSQYSSAKELCVYIGTTPDAEGLSTELFRETIAVSYKGSGHHAVTFSVPETGNYYIAFRCSKSDDTNDLYLDDINIEKIEIVPAAATEFTATAAADGVNSVELSWVNPAKDNADGELASLTKVELYRGTDLIATFDEAVPGEAVTYTDTEIAEPGVYTYSVCGYLDDKQGASVSAATGWVGIDTPVAPADLKLTVADDGSRQLEWSAVTEGTHGGYVNAEAVTYTVSRGDVVLADELAETTYTDSDDTLPLAAYTYRVTATCAGLTSAASATTPTILGGALELPYKPDFTKPGDFDLWTAANPDGTPNGNFKYISGQQAFACDYSSTTPWAFTPPFKAKKGVCRLEYKGTCYSARYTEDVDIYLCTTNNPLDVANFTLLEQYHVTSVSYPDVKSVEFEIPADGTYYIGYHLVTDDIWGFYLKQSDISQVSVTTGVGAIASDSAAGYNAAEGAIVAEAGATVAVYDLAGSLIVSATADAEGRVDVASLADGLYIAVVTDRAGASRSMKFVKK